MFNATFCLRKVGQNVEQWRDISTAQNWHFSCPIGEVMLRRRNEHPRTFTFQQGPVLYVGYGDIERAKAITNSSLENISAEAFYDEEFLLLQIDAAHQRVVLQRDAFCTMPLFYSFEEGMLTLSNDYGTVAVGIKRPHISNLSLMEALIALPINFKPSITEIHIPTERSRILWGGEHVQVQLPKPKARHRASNPLDFKSLLELTLDRYWGNAEGQGKIFELSGGIDSSIAPGYYTRRYGLQPECVTKIFPDSFQESQVAKIKDFAEIFGAHTHMIPITAQQHFPLRYIFYGGHRAPVYDSAEIYHDINSEMAALAQKCDATAVFTGVGGNELFEKGKWAEYVYAGPDEKARREKIRPAMFYTQTFQRRYEQSFGDIPHFGLPRPLVATSSLHAFWSRNNIYLDMGIWPISPLADPRLYDFCQGLDSRFIDNKNILRAYASAAGYPHSIFNPKVNEHAGYFFENAVMQYFPTVIKNVVQNSRLAAEGLVDRNMVYEVFKRVQYNELPRRTLFDIFKFVQFEHNAQVLNPVLS